MTCVDDFESVNPRLDRILTQYRESPKLIHLIRTQLRQVEMVAQAICDLPSFFDIDTAVGDQLTLLGKRLGFPREHCVCVTQPVFGFSCGDDDGLQILGFCEGASWLDCGVLGVSYVTITDDELYRKFLRSRIYQTQAYFDTDSLKTVVRMFWGDQAMILDRNRGRVVVAPGRDLTAAEKAVLQLYPRVLPVPLGIGIRFHLYSVTAVFGFGTGWRGFCQGDVTPGDPILTEDDSPILTERDRPLLTDAVDTNPVWMCALDVKPYDC
ncbi:DUF2612 domain-containing protein [Aureimonas flava]|uniref:DUF2612 domain-containing protein n=1 Tax=Aureimonas flava TaxID=2320271 RepID=A0A3A1WI09_9HYPH|nr:DUF2612 domain-containing protein [Aureimonas flava]RIY00224.1 DUF2612 domain-containing protein [Aureimonas flava]